MTEEEKQPKELDEHNRFNPVFYGEVIAAALASANQAVANNDEETKH